MTNPKTGGADGPKGGGAPSKGGPCRVLVVDDEVGFRELMTFELTSRGYSVVTAGDGDQAVEVAKAGPVDVVISDLTMPKRGGLDTLSGLKAVDPKIEVIMVTGYATLENAVESMKRGAYDFITKPFQIDDITRLIERAMDKRLLARRVDELQELNRLKSEFLANMSHELRTPMNAILGYTSLHLDRVYGEVTPKQEECLKRVEVAGKSLLQLINSILDLSKVAAGRMPVYLEEFNLAELAKEVLGMMDCIAKAKSLKLEADIPPGLRVRSDKTKVKQILVNLINNGIKFTSAGGIFLEARMDADKPRVRLKVRDTGIGIKPEDMSQLFQEFKQLDSSSTREHGGTGLGLVLCKRFAELLGGAVEVESAPGKGTTFTVLLPQEIETISEAQTTVFGNGGGQKAYKTLLAIDDDPEVLRLLRDSLHGSGYGFAGALTAEEGIALAKEIKPFAITLDIMMPHRDGWSVLQALKADPGLRSIPVIMVSILDNKGLGFALGVSDYIVKPFERRELLEKLKRAEGGKAGRSVMVVDDDAGVRDLLCQTLRAEGFSVDVAGDGRQALAKLGSGIRPDILLIDLMMPEVSGFEVLEAMEKDAELRRINVIVLTAKPLSKKEKAYLEKRTEMVLEKGTQNLAGLGGLVTKTLEALESSHELQDSHRG